MNSNTSECFQIAKQNCRYGMKTTIQGNKVNEHRNQKLLESGICFLSIEIGFLFEEDDFVFLAINLVFVFSTYSNGIHLWKAELLTSGKYRIKWMKEGVCAYIWDTNEASEMIFSLESKWLIDWQLDANLYSKITAIKLFPMCLFFSLLFSSLFCFFY